MTEHRSDARAPIHLKVVYRRLNSFFADYTKNVSKGGMFVRTARPLAVGERFAFRLELPSRPDPLDLAAEVVHVQGEGEGAGMGLRFVWEDEAASEAFARVVEGLMVQELGESTARELLGRAPDPEER